MRERITELACEQLAHVPLLEPLAVANTRSTPFLRNRLFSFWSKLRIPKKETTPSVTKKDRRPVQRFHFQGSTR